MMQHRLKVIPGAVARACATGAFTLAATWPALAQQTAADPSATRVEITGSRIRRIDVETPAPVQVITADDLQKSGFTTVSEVLQNLTANGQGTLSQGFSQAFAAGASGISLRGLTTAATLVLVDGHRTAPYPLSDDGQRSFVDISNIPFDAVERIEVLKDGASAVYGSDAMAGVVNIILKKSFKGTRVALEGGRATEGGGRTVHGSLTHGMGDYDADGYSGYVSLEYRHQDRITYQQRAGKGLWQNLDWTAYGGINKTPGVLTPQNQAPATLSPYLSNPANGGPSATNSYFYGGACPSYAALASGACAYQSALAEISPETENLNAIASFSKQLGSDWRLDLKASLFNSKAEQYPAGGLQTFPQSASPLVAVSAGVAPYIGTPGITSITVPSSYPGNPFGAPAVVNGIITDAPIPHTAVDSKATRLVADLRGSYADWDLSAALGYTRVSTQQDVYGTVNVPALNAALNRSSNPFLVTGGNSAADLAAIFPNTSANDVSTLSFAEFNGTRSLMKLPGGELGLSAGLSYVHRKLDSPAPGLIAQGIVGGNNAYVSGGQVDEAAYAELVAPVLKTLELDARARFDRFDNAGHAATPGLGFKWKPLEGYALRGTAARGFRAPNAAENGQSGQAFLAQSANDPLLCPGGVPPNGTNYPAGTPISYCSFQPVSLNSANPNLKPERSVSSTLGVILEPVSGWNTTFDLYQIQINNQIVAGSLDLSTAVRGSPVSTLCADGNGGTTTCQVNPILYVPVAYVNANSTKTSGWELGTSYRFTLGEYGSLLASADWSHTMGYVLTIDGSASQLAGTHGPYVIGGDTGNPKDRAALNLTWEQGPWQVATAFNYIGSFNLTDPSIGFDDCDTSVAFGGTAFFPSGGTPQQFCKVKSFLTTNLSVRYKSGEHWTLHGSVDNLFNTQPPVDLNTYGGGQLPYNPSMHLAGAIGRTFNVGAIYNF